jgi:hypothetical protein
MRLVRIFKPDISSRFHNPESSGSALQATRDEFAIGIKHPDGVFAAAGRTHARRQEGATIRSERKSPGERDDF